LRLLEQVDGDCDFVIGLLETFGTSAKVQLASCSRAARVCDTATLGSEAHLLKGGAAACYATQLASSCGALERMACLETATDASSATCPSEPPEYWISMVGDVAECLDALSHNLIAIQAMRTLPPFTTLMEAYGDCTDDIVGALSNLLEAAVDAYVASHAAMIFKDEKCDIGAHDAGEEAVGIAREKLILAFAAGKALSVQDLVRTTSALSNHLAKCRPLQAETALTTVPADMFRVQSDQKLDDMRVTLESLAAEIAVLLGERMPVLVISYAEHESESVTKVEAENAVKIESAATPSAIHVPTGWIGELSCDHYALLQITGDDHSLVAALLSSFIDSLILFADNHSDQQRSLFNARSLHGAAVSMRVPRVAAAISDFIVAKKQAQDTQETADITSLESIDTHVNAIENAIHNLRDAVHELANFQQAIENGEPFSRA
jgi:HPt (histidine-containing phosphotransfer) domain-containing protein